MNHKEHRVATLCVKDQLNPVAVASHQLPLYLTSSFVFENAEEGIATFKGEKDLPFYSRYGNPTVEMVADKIANLEGLGINGKPWALMTSSGMSAIATLMMSLLKAGDTLITQTDLYGGTTELFIKVLQPLGISPVFIDLKDEIQLKAALTMAKGQKVVYAETPSNPTLSVIDLKMLATIAQAFEAKTVVDNTFCTALVQQPLAWGIDFVVYSTTKYLNGHGNSIAGAIVGIDPAWRHPIWQTLKLAGTNCSPFEAWLTAQGLKTLALRLERHAANAKKIAAMLEKHPSVGSVNFCGSPSHPQAAVIARQMSLPTGMISFEVLGGQAAAIRLMNALNLFTQAPTLGDVDSLVLHPASSSHLNVSAELRQQAGIGDGLIRLSVGIEDADDLCEDLQQALEQIEV